MPRILRQRYWFGLTVDVDGLAGGIDDDPAILTTAEVKLQLRERYLVEVSVEVTGKFEKDRLAVHACCPCRKNGFNSSRNFKRARSSRDLTAASEMDSD